MIRWLPIVLCLFTACTESSVKYAYIAMDTTIVADSAMEVEVAPYRDSLSLLMSKVLVQSTEPILRGKPDSPLGSLIADVVLEEARKALPIGATQPEFCLLNIGGLRVDLPEGDVDVNRIFELMPFENSISLVKLSSEGMKNMLNHLIKVGGQPTSGIELFIKDSAVQKITINGKPLENRSYWVATSDYLADGGDKMDFFEKQEERVNLDLKIRDAIIQNFENRGQIGNAIAPILTKRITITP